MKFHSKADTDMRIFSSTRLKHLDHIQAIISRLSFFSMMYKLGALFIILPVSMFVSVENNIFCIALIGMCLVLDAYYLHQERLFRKLYSTVLQKKDDELEFKMNAHIYEDDISFVHALFATTTMHYYGIFVIMILKIFMNSCC